MKASICTAYGSPEVLQFAELQAPSPKANEIRVRLKATSVTAADSRIRAARFPKGMKFLGKLMMGFKKPKNEVLGVEFSGIVESVGTEVTKFKIGDQVLGFDTDNMGCHAELKCIDQNALVFHKPSSLSFEQAAALPFGGLSALHFMEETEVKSGQKALVVGASGCVGTALVQLLSKRNVQVTAVAGSANQELVKSLGAVEAIDYSKTDYIKSSQLNAGFDVVFDCVGAHTFKEYKPLLKEKGRCALISGGMAQIFGAMFSGLTGGGKKAFAGMASEKPEHFKELLELAENGRYQPFIDKTYTFDLLSEAHAYVDTGRKKGSVVITL